MGVCKNCGRYFALMGRTNTEYCSQPFDEKSRTCREVGAIALWTKWKSGDTLFRDYRREYKKRFACMKSGKLEPEELYAWGEHATEKKRGRSGKADPGGLRCLAAGIMIKKEKHSGADCMQPAPLCLRSGTIFYRQAEPGMYFKSRYKLQRRNS